MGLLEALLDDKTPRPTGVPGIASWRIYKVEKHTVEASFRQGVAGGPYNPPTLKNTIEAEIFVHWADGTCTQGTLTRAQLEQPVESLLALHSQAYPEPHPDIIPEPTDLADVRVCIPEVREAILHDPTELVTPVYRMQNALRGTAALQARGSLGAQYAVITYASSMGMYATHEATRVSYGADIASRAIFNHELRALPSEQALDIRLERLCRDYQQLMHPFEGSVTAPRVVLSAVLTRQFFQYYLQQNLSMQAILNGSSAFTRGDLEARARLFHPDLSILDAPGRHEHPWAFRLDGRGQAPQSRLLISEGRLAGADVSLRAAAQGGLDPTPTSLTDNWVVRGPAAAGGEDDGASLEACLRAVENGVYIYSVLGLHTQDPTRGAYSLGVPRALVVRDGKLVGFVRGTLVGNFFEDLRVSPRAYVDPLSDMPMLEVQGTFTMGD